MVSSGFAIYIFLIHIDWTDQNLVRVHFYVQLKDYPAEACKLQLLVLDLSNNSFSGLPAEMGKLALSCIFVLFTL